MTFLHMVGWDGDSFESLSEHPIELGLNVPIIPQRNQAGIYEMRFERGGYGVFSKMSRTLTYQWSRSTRLFELVADELTRPQSARSFAYGAADALGKGQLDEALTLALDALRSSDATDKHDRVLAFAEFQVVLAYVLLGDDAAAAEWATSGNFATQPYARVKEAFWDAYVESGAYEFSAEIARQKIRLLGNQKLQINVVSHYTDPAFHSLDEIVPCDSCLSGVELGGISYR